MPCTDGREAYEAELDSRRRDALTALLCGVMNTDKRALEFAVEWCTHHAVIDQLRKAVKYNWQDQRIFDARHKCDEVLDRAHAALCV